MADELIAIAQPFRVHDRITVNRDCIFERRAEREASLTQHIDIFQEAKGARVLQLIPEAFWRDIECFFLTPDQCRLKLDLDRHAETPRKREKFRKFAVMFNTNRL